MKPLPVSLAGASAFMRMTVEENPMAGTVSGEVQGIQPSIIKDIERVIRLLRERGDMGILLCEQYVDFAHALADRFVVLSRGEVVASGGKEAMDGEDVKRHLSVSARGTTGNTSQRTGPKCGCTSAVDLLC
jgi:ABC-type multidrug transport system ATPase subunit